MAKKKKIFVCWLESKNALSFIDSVHDLFNYVESAFVTAVITLQK